MLVGTVSLKSTIAANNTGAQPDVSGTFTSDGFNLIEDTSGASFAPQPTDITGQDPALDALGNYGGPTQTHQLQAGSPAIDKGISNSFTTDQRGVARAVDDPVVANAAGGDGTDIGSYELDFTQAGPTFVVNTNGDGNDGTCSGADCSLREAINSANG